MLAVRAEVTYPWSLLHTTQAKLETSCHFDCDDLRVWLWLHERGEIVMEPMVSHLVPIDEALGIYDALTSRGEELLGVLFD